MRANALSLSPMVEATDLSLGDRVERAIERHADMPGEIARGEQEKPRNLRRNAIWLPVRMIDPSCSNCGKGNDPR